MEQEVKFILGVHLGISSILIEKSDKLKEDLGLDSLDCVEVMMELEETYDVSIPDEDALDITTVEDIILWLEDNINSFEKRLDRQYRAGFMAGWNAGVSGNEKTKKQVERILLV